MIKKTCEDMYGFCVNIMLPFMQDFGIHSAWGEVDGVPGVLKEMTM